MATRRRALNHKTQFMDSYPLGKTTLRVSRMGLGTSGLGNLYDETSTKVASDTLEAAWNGGIRYFDTAPFYGHGLSERRVGDFLRDKPRDEYVLSTKIGRLLRPGPAADPSDFVNPLPFKPVFDYSYDGVMRSFEDSQQRLGLDRIDILYLHDIGRLTHGDRMHEYYRTRQLDGGFRALDELRSDGRIKAFGLGVNETAICHELLDHADIDCLLLAGRLSLLEQREAGRLIERCRPRGTSLVIGGVFNSGILATGAVDGARYDYQPASLETRERVERIHRHCNAHAVDLPTAALRFPFGDPNVASVLVGAAKASIVQRSIGALDVYIPPALWDALINEDLLCPTAQWRADRTEIRA